ncbi:hypothetical protein [Candidatus Uabimicrobium sp. HlEnr_7]|uniref:hypothetical protein n=1 Tax=Candidatus Uabimicrobium helgolandensis TaxID=3095367 RepID=UPI0035576FE7
MDNDLLSPTLTIEDESIGIDEPWNPNIILFITFFFGLITGGLLLAYNFGRLGMGKYLRLTIIITIFLATIISVCTFLLIAENIIDVKNSKEKTLLRVGQRGLSLFIAFCIIRKQRKRYRLAQMCDIENGSLWSPAIAAIVAAIFIGGFINGVVKIIVIGLP